MIGYLIKNSILFFSKSKSQLVRKSLVANAFTRLPKEIWQKKKRAQRKKRKSGNPKQTDKKTDRHKTTSSKTRTGREETESNMEGTSNFLSEVKSILYLKSRGGLTCCFAGRKMGVNERRSGYVRYVHGIQPNKPARTMCRHGFCCGLFRGMHVHIP